MMKFAVYLNLLRSDHAIGVKATGIVTENSVTIESVNDMKGVAVQPTESDISKIKREAYSYLEYKTEQTA